MKTLLKVGLFVPTLSALLIITTLGSAAKTASVTEVTCPPFAEVGLLDGLAFNPAGLKFPWPAPDNWYYTGGPHSWPPFSGGPRSGLDFAPGSNNRVLAAAEGEVIYRDWLDNKSGQTLHL